MSSGSSQSMQFLKARQRAESLSFLSKFHVLRLPQDFAPKRRTLNEVMIFNPHYVNISVPEGGHPEKTALQALDKAVFSMDTNDPAESSTGSMHACV